MTERISEVPAIVRRLYALVTELEEIFPGRHFTPDGHLVGSLGEVIATYMFGLTLNSASTKSSDAIAPDGSTVEIKATQGTAVALTSDPVPMPDRLIVLHLTKDGNSSVVYNGPAAPAWELAGKRQKTGQSRASLGRLRLLDTTFQDSQRLPILRPLVAIHDGQHAD